MNEPWFSALRVKFALLRLACFPLSDDPPRNTLLWRRVWLPLMSARYHAAEALWGRERARVYDWVPF